MATEFLTTCGPNQSGVGEYTSLSAWEAGVETDLTLATTRVYTHGGITGSIADNATVTGQNNSYQAAVVHCTTTQILVEHDTGGETFEASEQVQVDGSNYVTIDSGDGGGDTAIARAQCKTSSSAEDNTELDFAGWTYNDTNKIIIGAATGHEAKLSGRDATRYQLVDNANWNEALSIVGSGTVELTNLQIGSTVVGGSGGRGVSLVSGFTGTVVITNCRFTNRGTGTKGSNDYCIGVHVTGAGSELELYNSIFEGWGYGLRALDRWSDAITIKVYNSVFYNNTDYNLRTTGSQITGTYKNIASYNSADDFDVGGTIDYCATDDDDGTNSQVPSDWTDVFEDHTQAGGGDFRLKSTDTDLMDNGVGPGSDSDVPSTDMDGDSRSGGSCDIGADEYVAAGTFATGAADIPAIDADADADYTRDATAAADVPAVDADADADYTRDATGAADVPAVDSDADADYTRDATGAADIPAVDSDADADYTRDATGAADIPAVDADGNATKGLVKYATGAATLGAVSAEAQALRNETIIGPLTSSADADDGYMTYTSPTWNFWNDTSAVYSGDQEGQYIWTFFRFTLTTAIPNNAVIRDSSELSLWGHNSSGWGDAADYLRIRATDSSDAAQPADEGDRPTESGGSTVTTTASVRWPSSGGLTWNAGQYNDTPSLATIIQELVDDNGGLANGAHICLWLRGGQIQGTTNFVGIRAYDFYDEKPQLTIIFKSPATGAADIPAIVADGDAVYKRDATGAADIPAIDSEAQATKGVEKYATGAATLGAVSAAAPATYTRDATGAAELGAVSATAESTYTRDATGAADLSPVTSVATATYTRDATGTAELGAVTSAAVATRITTRTATAAATLAAVTSSAAATYTRNAAAAAVIAAITADGTGVLGVTRLYIIVESLIQDTQTVDSKIVDTQVVDSYIV